MKEGQGVAYLEGMACCQSVTLFLAHPSPAFLKVSIKGTSWRMRMFPLQFDRQVLATLPMLSDEAVRRVTQILKAILNRRVVPYFKRMNGTVATLLAGLVEHIYIGKKRIADIK